MFIMSIHIYHLSISIICPSIYLYLYLSIHPSIHPSVRPSIRPSIHPSIHPSTYLKFNKYRYTCLYLDPLYIICVYLCTWSRSVSTWPGCTLPILHKSYILIYYSVCVSALYPYICICSYPSWTGTRRRFFICMQ